MNPLLTDEVVRRSVTMRIADLKGALNELFFVIFVTFMQNGPGRMMAGRFRQQMDRGETIWLDDLETRRSLPPEQRRRSGEGLSAEYTFEHFDPNPYDSAISIAVTMDMDGMRYATTARASTAIVDGYSRAAAASVELAKRIRALGWEALAASNVGADTAEVQHMPLAIQAGLGQLGKHGSLITKEFGSNLRLATVLTNMPLAYDEPIDIGVDDFCARCQICITNCPPQAIFDDKQMVRGAEKWYVDFDKCIPYFAMHNSCAICVAVCPWTEPGLGETISLKCWPNDSSELSIRNLHSMRSLWIRKTILKDDWRSLMSEVDTATSDACQGQRLAIVIESEPSLEVRRQVMTDTRRTVSPRIQVPAETIREFCQRNHIRLFAFFGSVLREDFGEDSDVDILIEFEPDSIPGFQFFSMQEELSRILGREVDLNTLGFLSPHMRETIQNEAVVQYVKQ